MTMIPKTVKELRDYLDTFKDYDGCLIYAEVAEHDDEADIALVIASKNVPNCKTIAYLKSFVHYDWAGEEVDSKP